MGLIFRLLPVWLLCCVAPAWGSEICRFAGTTDYRGNIAVTTIVGTNAADRTTTVDVRLGFNGTPMPLMHTNYLMQEISTWKAAELQGLAVNSRYRVDGRVVRQIWDVFTRGGDGLRAYRLEANRRADLARQHPSFLGHWDAASFGQPWLGDFWRANPERRPDLDPPAAAAVPDVRSPLALAFYWAERLPHAGQVATVFLPGFKRDKSVSLAIGPVGPTRGGVQPWATSVRYPALGTPRPSSAEAWVSADGHLLQLAARVRTRDRTAEGVIRQEGCIGTPDRN